MCKWILENLRKFNNFEVDSLHKFSLLSGNQVIALGYLHEKTAKLLLEHDEFNQTNNNIIWRPIATDVDGRTAALESILEHWRKHEYFSRLKGWRNERCDLMLSHS